MANPSPAKSAYFFSGSNVTRTHYVRQVGLCGLLDGGRRQSSVQVGSLQESGDIFSGLVFRRNLVQQKSILFAAGFELPQQRFLFVREFLLVRPFGFEFFNLLEDSLDEAVDALRITAEFDGDLILRSGIRSSLDRR